MQNEDLSSAVAAAASNGDAARALRSIYAELQTQIDRRKPICVASGKCCNFEAYGHRLYVTTLELAVFSVDLTNPPFSRAQEGTPQAKRDGFLPRSVALPLATTFQDAAKPGCPLQTGKLCGVHVIRPFGCRIFFCDPTATQWQQDQYEAFHARIKLLHQQFDIPYFYVEWREGLHAIGVTK